MAKKTFKKSAEETPAASVFLSNPANEEETAPVKPKLETKTSRMNILLRPSVRTGIEKLAYVKRTSPNDLINIVLEDFVNANKADVAKYDSFFGIEKG